MILLNFLSYSAINLIDFHLNIFFGSFPLVKYPIDGVLKVIAAELRGKWSENGDGDEIMAWRSFENDGCCFFSRE